MKLTGVVILVGVGVGFAWLGWTMGIQGYHQAVENADVTVEGTVVSAEIDRHRQTGHSGSGYVYDPAVTYRYSYEGKTYTSNNVHAGPGSLSGYGDRSKAQDVIDKYAEGSTVTVSLNPDDPSQSFLDEESPAPLWGYYAFTGIGVLLVVLAVGGFLKSSFDGAT